MAKAKKIKVGFVFDDSLDSYDGVSQYVKTLGSWLSRQGHDVRYLVGETKMVEWSAGKVYSLSKNKKVSFNGNQARIPLVASTKKIKKVLNDEQFDVLHVQVPYSPFMAQKVINSSDRKTAVVGTFHVAPGSVFAKWGGHILRMMYGKSIGRFDEMLSVSTAAEHYAETAFHLKTKLLPNVIELDRFSGAYRKKKTRKILFFGRLVNRKGAKELIEAFSILQQYNKDVDLTIAGSGPMRRELEELTKKLKIESKVEFLGFIEEDDKPNLLASAEIVCFPSLGGESFGIVLLEAMAAGAGVVIGGDNPGYRSVLGKKEQVLFDPANALAFAGKLSEIIDNKEIQKELHAWQQQEVKKYDVGVVGTKLVRIYNQAIAKRLNKGHN